MNVDDVLQKHGGEIQEAAKQQDAEPAIVILAAEARGEMPPAWAVKQLKKQA